MSIRQYLVTVNDQDDEISIRAAVAKVPSGMQVQFADMNTGDLAFPLALRFPLLYTGKMTTLPHLSLNLFRRWFA